MLKQLLKNKFQIERILSNMKIEQAKISDASKIVDININEWINTYTGIFPTDFLKKLKNKKRRKY